MINSFYKVIGLQRGYFGVNTAVAAIDVSIILDKVYSIVSRGGRPDMVGPESIQKVKTHTLLIVGSNDSKAVIDINKKALKQLKNAKSKELVIIPNAGHLFEERDAIEQVAK